MSEAGSATGGRVVGRYALYDELAAGGMATVHIGRLIGEVGFTRSVAIKRLHPQFAKDPEFATMFLEEARIAARIRHPNVVPVLDVVSMDGELFLVMEYVQGETLTRLTRVARDRNRIVPMPIALAIATDMLAGLHAAHEAKDELGQPLHIVHRDISPHNVMVGRDGSARVLDFGIAKAASSSQSTQEGLVKGKFAYMSPEQLSSVPVDRRADVFAASIVLWEMLTGRRLFQGSDTAALVGQVLHAIIKPPGMVATGLPPALDALVMRGLERDLTTRFASAREMQMAIENLGVTIARPAEVGKWVDRIAGDSLKRRARRIEQIEKTGSFSIPPPSTSGPLVHEVTGSASRSGTRPVSADRIDVADDSQEIQVDIPIDFEPRAEAKAEPAPAPKPEKRSRAPRVLLTLLLALAAAAAVFVWRSGGVQPAKAKAALLVGKWLAQPEPVGAPAPAALPAPVASASDSAAPAVASAPPSAAPAAPDPALASAATLDLGAPVASSHAARGRASGRTKANPASTATTAATTEPAVSAPVAAAEPQSQRPAQAQLQIAIKALMPAVRACVASDEEASRATVVFQSNGTVKSVSVSGFAAGKPQEGCIKGVLARAKVDAFSDATFSLPVTVQP